MDAARQNRQTLQALARHGVLVAAGRGSAWQRTATGAAALAIPLVLLVIAPANPALWWVLPLAVLVVDLLSGVVHWLFDTHISPGPGRLGPAAVNFLDHHVNPTRSAEVGFAATSWRVAIWVTGPLLALALVLPPGQGQAWAFWLGALALVVAQAHKEAHKRRPAAAVRWLQRWHLCLPPGAHRQHHRDHGRAFCVFTGWCNPLLDRLQVWRRLDRLIAAQGIADRDREVAPAEVAPGQAGGGQTGPCSGSSPQRSGRA
jgi:hypothetical protein